jgi:hypothetical protein
MEVVIVATFGNRPLSLTHWPRTELRRFSEFQMPATLDHPGTGQSGCHISAIRKRTAARVTHALFLIASRPPEKGCRQIAPGAGRQM